MSSSTSYVPKTDRVPLLVLHVGPPKTGTSILQHTLAENGPSLEGQGVLYPALRPRPGSDWDAAVGEPTGVKHDYLLLLALTDPTQTLVCRRFGLQQDAQLENLRSECLEGFEGELETARPETLILSSEIFGNMAAASKERLAELADYLHKIADRVEVVLYARHPIAMLRSRQQHLLKGGMMTMNEVDKPWIYPYGRALSNLTELFDRDSVTAVPFERDYDTSFDLVGSFAELVGLSTEGWTEPVSKANASLSMEGALIASALAKEFPQPGAMAGKSHPKRAPMLLVNQVAGRRFRLSEETEAATMRRSEADLLLLAERYGIKFPDLAPVEGDLWDEGAVRSVSMLLNRLGRQVASQRTSKASK